MILNTLTFMSFVFFRTHILEDNTLQLQLHLYRLTMNGYLRSKGFKSIRVGLTMHGSSFKDRHFFAKGLLKLNNTTNTCLIRLNIILYYS